LYKILVGKPEEKRLLGRPRFRWKDGIRMNLREIGSDPILPPKPWSWIGFDWLRIGTGGGLL
jgi:hypothetical protein